MFWEFYLLSLAGFAIYVLISFFVMQTGTPGLSTGKTIHLYFSKNTFFISAGFILLTVIDYLLTMEGSEFIINWFSNSLLDGGTPFGIKFFAFLIGLFISLLFERLRALIKPMDIKVEKKDQ